MTITFLFRLVKKIVTCNVRDIRKKGNIQDILYWFIFFNILHSNFNQQIEYY